MPRVSRKKIDNKPSKQRSVYRACIYTRLSKERTEEWRNKSGSIENQVEICEMYAKEEGITVTEVFTDYQYSGTNFDRPAYIEMMDKIREGKINCIIIRDLSRLGREHLEVGRLIDKVFPFLGVRFISVDDKLDTLKEVDQKKSFEVTIKNLINDMYAKDISKKVKSSKMEKAKQGSFLGCVPSYGYKVVEKDGIRCFEKDENTAPIMERIFREFFCGKSMYNIALGLNEDKITTPMTYYRTKRMTQNEGDSQWVKSTISKMIIKEVYCGHMVQGKRSQNLVEGKKIHRTSKDEWIVVKNTHEAFITDEELNFIINKRRDNKDKHFFSYPEYDTYKDPINRYRGLIFSYHTGEELIRRYQLVKRNYGVYRKYVFMNNRYNGKLRDKSLDIRIHEDVLDDVVSKLLKEAMTKIGSQEEYKSQISKQVKREYKTLEKKNETISMRIDNLQCNLSGLYEKYRVENWCSTKYIKEKEKLQKKLEGYKEDLNVNAVKMQQLTEKQEKLFNLVDSLFSACKLEKLDENLIKLLISRIDVTHDKNINIIFNFDINEIKGGVYSE